MSELSYGDVVHHTHSALANREYTFLARGYVGYQLLEWANRTNDGCEGGFLGDFGYGYAWWLCGRWELPEPPDDLQERIEAEGGDYEEEQDIVVELEPVSAERVRELMSSMFGGEA